jgi:RNA polymerase sigma factor (sigma-70 family)
MAQSSLQNVLTFARRMAGAAETNQVADSELLDQFARSNDQRSFALLIERHGPMVWGSCRRALDSPSDIEDCFQATFLVLARKAGSLKRGEALGGWLHRVAVRLSMRCQRSALKRRRKEEGAALMNGKKEEPRESWDELRSILDRELEQLPQIYRVVLVLCYLEGKSNAQAARELGCPLGTVKGRIVRGKVLLRRRLEQRGMTLGSTALAALLTEHCASAAVPGLLMATTTTAAAQFALGKTASASGSAIALADAFLRVSTLGGLLQAMLVTAGLMLAAGGGGLLAQPAWRDSPNEPGVNRKRAVVGTSKAGASDLNKPTEKLDQFGDPLPPYAISRLGSVRYRPGFETRSLLMTPDGKQVISDGVDGVRHWEISTGKELQTLSWGEASGMDTGRSFTANRKLFVATSETDRLGVYEVKSGARLLSLGDGEYYLPAFSADGRYIAAFRRESPNEIELFDAMTGKSLWKCGRYLNHVRKLLFTPDSKRLVVSGCNLIKDPKAPANGLFVLNSATGEEERKFEFGFDQVADVAISPDSKEVAVVFFAIPDSPKGNLRIWDLSTSKQRLRIQPPESPAGMSGKYFFLMSYFPAKGNILVTAIANDDRLSVRDLVTGAEIKRLGRGLYNVACMTESLDGKTLIVAGDGRICLIDMETGRDATELFVNSASTPVIKFAHDNKTILLSNWRLADSSEEISSWDAKTGKKLQQRSVGKGHLEQMLGDTAGLVIEYPRITIRPYLKDLSTGKTSDLSSTFELTPGSYWAASANGRFVAVGDSEQETINLFEGKTGSRIHVLRTAGLTTNKLQFSSDETLLFAFSPNQTTRIWDLSTGGKLAEYLPQKISEDGPRPTGYPQGAHVPPRRINEEPRFDIALSPDGKRIASTDFRGYLLIRDALDGKHQVRIDTGKIKPSKMRFSPDSKLLVWSSFDSPDIHIFDVETQKEIAVFVGHKGIVQALEFSNDGKKLVSSSTDGTALVWDFERIAAGKR